MVLDMSALQKVMQTYYQFPQEHVTVQQDGTYVFVSSGLSITDVEPIITSLLTNNGIDSGFTISVIPYDVFERYLSGQTNNRPTI